MQRRSISNRKKPLCHTPALDYLANVSHVNDLTTASEFCRPHPPQDSFTSKLRTIYNAKKASTFYNFNKSKRKILDPRPEFKKQQPMTIDQYFCEMEKRNADSFFQPNGKRGASTAVPGNRRDKSGEGGKYVLGPVQLLKTKGMRGRIGVRHNRVGTSQFPDEEKNWEGNSVVLEKRVKDILVGQQNYGNSRPESRYNKDSMCASLEHMGAGRSDDITKLQYIKDKHRSFYQYSNNKEPVKWQAYAPMTKYDKF